MACSFLADAKLPKRYWYWALCKATTQMNLLPIKKGQDFNHGDFLALPDLSDTSPPEPSSSDTSPPEPSANLAFGPSSTSESPSNLPKSSTNQHISQHKQLQEAASKLSTPYTLFFGSSPDYRVFFPFRCVGYFQKPFLPSGQKTSNFHEQTHPGIALGQSDYSNAIMFWDPISSQFCVLSDYKLDINWSLLDAFPDLKYNGSFSLGELSGTTSPKEPFPPGSAVFAIIQNEFYSGTVVAVPTLESLWYTIQLDTTSETFTANPMDLLSPDDPLFPVDWYQTDFTPLLPSWIRNHGKITLNVDGTLCTGYLSL